MRPALEEDGHTGIITGHPLKETVQLKTADKYLRKCLWAHGVFLLGTSKAVNSRHLSVGLFIFKFFIFFKLGWWYIL